MNTQGKRYWFSTIHRPTSPSASRQAQSWIRCRFVGSVAAESSEKCLAVEQRRLHPQSWNPVPASQAHPEVLFWGRSDLCLLRCYAGVRCDWVEGPILGTQNHILYLYTRILVHSCYNFSWWEFQPCPQSTICPMPFMISFFCKVKEISLVCSVPSNAMKLGVLQIIFEK
jgi:hypothetical protein